MIKLDGVFTLEKVENGKKYGRCDLLADTQAEVKAIGTNGATVIGLDSDTVLTMGSSAFTSKTKELGVLSSDGVWNF